MSQEKTIRKQIRNVLQEHLTGETLKLVTEQMTLLLNTRLDQIEKYVRTNLEAQDKRARSIQGFLVQTVQTDIQQQIYNASITIDAFLELQKEHGVQIEDFNAKMDAKKQEVHTRRVKAADDQMRAEMETRAAQAQAPAAETPAVEPTSESV